MNNELDRLCKEWKIDKANVSVDKNLIGKAVQLEYKENKRQRKWRKASSFLSYSIVAEVTAIILKQVYKWHDTQWISN